MHSGAGKLAHNPADKHHNKIHNGKLQRQGPLYLAAVDQAVGEAGAWGGVWWGHFLDLVGGVEGVYGHLGAGNIGMWEF